VLSAPSPARPGYPRLPAAGRIAFAAKSGKDKTAYKLFGTRLKVSRVSFATSATAEVFGRFLPSRQVVADGLCSRLSIQNESGLSAPTHGEEAMTIDPVLINPLIALIAGILILLMPRLLNYVVAIYLIAIGIIGLAHHFQ
jgi:hypothetical protein